QANAELVFSHLTHGTYTTVTQVVDIVHHALTVTDGNERLHYVNDIFVGQSAFTSFGFATQTTVELHATNGGEVIALLREEQVLEQRLSRFFGWWLTRAHHAIDFHQCFQLGAGRIYAQSFGNKGTAIQFVSIESFNFIHTQSSNLGQDIGSDF